MMIATAFAVLTALAEVTISGVSARQRWPWNNLVDVDFTVNDAPLGESYAVQVSAAYGKGLGTAIAKTFETEPIATGGVNRLVWNLGADYPDLKADDFSVTVTVTPFSDATPIYLVVDLSGGSSAAKWPVRYTTTPPAHVQGATNEACQLTELWLRRIPAGKDVLGHEDLVTTGVIHFPSHTAILTQPFYCAIFETTNKQFERMTGGYGATETHSADQFGEARPTTKYSHYSLRRRTWPTSASVSGGLIATIRMKTGLDGFDIPTEAQWEYACRAGTDGALYGNLDEIGRHSGNASEGQEGSGSAVAGSYLPNAWGLYDMIGNVRECCRDRYSVNAAHNIPKKGRIYTNPLGPTAEQVNASTKTRFSTRGAWWGNSKDYHKAYFRGGVTSDANSSYGATGFRLVMVVGGVHNDNEEGDYSDSE